MRAGTEAEGATSASPLFPAVRSVIVTDQWTDIMGSTPGSTPGSIARSMARHPSNAARGGSWGERRPRELAQPFAADEVLAAALFRPNAPGHRMLNPSGSTHEVAGRGIFLGEQLLVAVTPVEVILLTAPFGNWRQRALITARRSEVTVETVVTAGRDDPRWPAIQLGLPGLRVLEVRARLETEESWRVLELLLRRSPSEIALEIAARTAAELVADASRPDPGAANDAGTGVGGLPPGEAADIDLRDPHAAHGARTA
jgi:hypothetical protein